MKRDPDPHRHLLALLTEVVAVARALVEPMPAAKPGHNTKSKTPGIYPHQSKYNPWRASVWDSRLKKAVYIGAFPTVRKAKAAQVAYRAGQDITQGTKAVRLVASA